MPQYFQAIHDPYMIQEFRAFGSYLEFLNYLILGHLLICGASLRKAVSDSWSLIPKVQRRESVPPPVSRKRV